MLLFVSAYLVLYMFPFPLDHIPLLTEIAGLYTAVIEQIVIFSGKRFLGITDIRHHFNGSGDTIYEYVRVFTIIIISALSSLILFLSVGKKINYKKLFDFVLLYARYFVGLYLLYYGFAKIFDGQFSYPGFGKLEQRIGDSSPMGLLWTFMGSSKAYSAFSGYLELLGGYFLLFKRTKTLGSLITLAAVVNVAMLNFCYDVPVKLFSSHLALISVIIIAPDLKALYRFFLLHQSAQLLCEESNEKNRAIRFAAKSLIIWGITVLTLYQHIQFSSTYGSLAPKQPLEGTYLTKLFVHNKDTLAPLTTDTLRWKLFTISQGISNIKSMADSTERYYVRVDNETQTIGFASQKNPDETYSLMYEEKADTFILSGNWKNQNILAMFTKKTYNDYRLTNRGFHWINEMPYNR